MAMQPFTLSHARFNTNGNSTMDILPMENPNEIPTKSHFPYYSIIESKSNHLRKSTGFRKIRASDWP